MGYDFDKFLERHGYVIGTTGGKYFSMLLEAVICMLQSGKNNQEIKEELPRIMNDYCRYFRVPDYVYHSEMVKYIKLSDSVNPKNRINVQKRLITLGRKYVNQKMEDNKFVKQLSFSHKNI